MATASSGMLDAALGYAARGWPVFPCRPGAKVPATPRGFRNASTLERDVRSWWAASPEANVAIATGAPAVDVLDLDVKDGGNGFEAFNRLKRAGMLSGAMTLIRTPSGGLHVYYAGSGQRSGSLHRYRVDFKAAGGYVLAPPSVVGAGTYEVLDSRAGGAGIDWAAVVRLLDPPRPARPNRRRGRRGVGVEQLAAWLARQCVGNRNKALFWAACRAIEGGQAANLPTLVGAAVDAGLTEREARRTVDSAFRNVTRKVSGTPHDSPKIFA